MSVPSYCSADMLTMLRDIADGRKSGPASTAVARSRQTNTRDALMARDWIDRDGRVTDAGRNYLTLRGAT
jgi:hypothetical protein